MPSYFTFIPNGDMPTAEIEAESTKHARTAYLDYIARTGLIGWNDRKAARRLTITKKMEPGEIQTQLHLDYSIQPQQPEMQVEIPQQYTDQTPVEQYQTPIPVERIQPQQQIVIRPQPQIQPVQVQTIQSAQQTMQRNPFAGSPISDLSRRSRGL